MKPISERNLLELADLMYESGLEIWYDTFSARLREIHAEYEQRWDNLSVSEKNDAIACPADAESIERNVYSVTAPYKPGDKILG